MAHLIYIGYAKNTYDPKASTPSRPAVDQGLRRIEQGEGLP